MVKEEREKEKGKEKKKRKDRQVSKIENYVWEWGVEEGHNTRKRLE